MDLPAENKRVTVVMCFVLYKGSLEEWMASSQLKPPNDYGVIQSNNLSAIKLIKREDI